MLGGLFGKNISAGTVALRALHSGAPLCSAVIIAYLHCTLLPQVADVETQKAMMAWYHKKQEEQKVRPSSAIGMGPVLPYSKPHICVSGTC